MSKGQMVGHGVVSFVCEDVHKGFVPAMARGVPGRIGQMVQAQGLRYRRSLWSRQVWRLDPCLFLLGSHSIPQRDNEQRSLSKTHEQGSLPKGQILLCVTLLETLGDCGFTLV